MGKVHTGNGWLIRVQGNEHPPVHVHVLHPDGKAVIDVDGSVTNDGVPAKVIKQRFPDEVVNELLAIKWWEWPVDKITRNLPAIVGADVVALKNAE